jgi:hypothetical protein
MSLVPSALLASGPERPSLILHLDQSIGIHECAIFPWHRNAEGAPKVRGENLGLGAAFLPLSQTSKGSSRLAPSNAPLLHAQPSDDSLSRALPQRS